VSIPQLIETNESAFQATDPVRRIFSHENARRFAVIKPSRSVGQFAISWRSDLIQPSVVMDDNSQVIWIAVDERVAAVASDGQILFSMATNTPVLSLEQLSDSIVAISEGQAVVINRDCCIRVIIDFPDIVQNFKVAEKRLMVEFADGNTVDYSL
jgi:hypothetical protein